MSMSKTINTSQKKLRLQPAFSNRYDNHHLPVNRQNAQLSVKNSRSQPLVSLPIKANNGLHRYVSTPHLTHSTENIPELTRECTICLSEQTIHEFHQYYSDECEHNERTICDTCMYNYLKSLLEDLIDQNKMRCLEPNCLAVIPVTSIRYIFMLRNNLQLFDRYDRQITHRYLEQNREFIWCAYNTCGSGQFHDMGVSSNPMMTCIKCSRHTCVYHRNQWHVGMTCQEYDQLKRSPIDYDTQLWLMKHSKICPNCHSYIQKISGCDHMTCRRCGYQFCWQCLVNYRNIQRYGLGQHKDGCSHRPIYYRSLNNLSSHRSTNCHIL
ncbi:unnamed protein product [Adineta ricciae]|uniref:RBR-type E3 ubiquitin transferase n=1 Tax=Adineta ricciae TaxID=249248 RepID=A0A815ETK4_ADIRI|nr:unnamed protein product [Adineta ricciae]